MTTHKTRRTLALLRGLVKRGRACTDLVDIISDEEVRTWERLSYDGQTLGTAWCEGSNRETWPEWAREVDVDTALGIPFGRDSWLRWALQNGVAPGQPFLVRMDRPVGHYDAYNHEYDEDYSGELVEVRPIPLRLALKRWEHFLRKLEAEDAMEAAARASFRKLVERDTGRMYVRQFLYDSNHSHGNWGLPTGIGFKLETSHNPPYTLVEARSDSGDRKKAMEELQEKACAMFPQLTPELALGLEIRR